jgi:hypothetical protein
MDGRLAVPVALLALAGCRQESPEAQIKKTFDACLKAIEEGDASRPGEALGPQFSGPEGMSGDEAKLFLAALLRTERVGVTVFSSRIEVQGSRGAQTVEVLLTSRSGGGLLPQDASRKTYLLRWERLEGKWRLGSLTEP